MNAPSPSSLKDSIFSTYRPYIPARNKDAFYDVLDAATPSANPSNPREPNPHPQWVLDALDQCDALVDPYNPLPEEARKTVGAIRLAALDQLMRLAREARRRTSGELPL